jgi:acylpyruvate hydrolase
MVGFLSRGEEAFSIAKIAGEFAASWLKDKRVLPKTPEGDDLDYPVAGVTLAAPVPRPGKIIAMGLNFYDHAAENKVPLPEMPVGFLKAATSITGPGADVPYPRSTKQLDYEIEMAIVIGKKGKDIPKEKAMEHVVGYTILNDLSARDIQSKEMSKRLVLLSKSLDGLGPMGPWLVTKDEIPDPNNLAMELYVNEEAEPRQKSNTNQMVFKVADLVAYWSQMTLEPGDIISSGTPGGVGIFRQPPEKWLLKPGDVVEAKIERLGILRNQII